MPKRRRGEKMSKDNEAKIGKKEAGEIKEKEMGKKKENNSPKVIDLNKVAEKIYEEVYKEMSKNVNEVFKGINNSLGNIAYRLYSIELILYKDIKGNKIDKEVLNEALLQEDILFSNVETLIKKIREVKLKNEEALRNDTEKTRLKSENVKEEEKELKKKDG